MICIEYPFWLILIMRFVYHVFSVSLIYNQSGSYTIRRYTNQIWFWAYLRSFLKLVGSCSYQDLRLDQDHLSLHFYYLYDIYIKLLQINSRTHRTLLEKRFHRWEWGRGAIMLTFRNFSFIVSIKTLRQISSSTASRHWGQYFRL